MTSKRLFGAGSHLLSCRRLSEADSDTALSLGSRKHPESESAWQFRKVPQTSDAFLLWSQDMP